MNEICSLDAANLRRIGGTRVDGVRVEVPVYGSGLRKRICHLGIGRFHRAHQAEVLHRLLQAGLAEGWGICAIGLRSADRPVLRELIGQDGLYSLWTLDGMTRRASVIGSIMSLVDASEDASAALEVLADVATHIISLTVTEAGYCLRPDGALDLAHPDIVHDLAHPQQPRSAPGLIVRALARRRDAGRSGLTLMSCDNLIGNGHQLHRAVHGFAQQVDASLLPWIEAQVSFPCSMVDRITPVPDETAVAQAQADWGVQDRALVMCEPWQQWVLEDRFVAGRPAFEQAGVIFTGEVDAWERIKVGLLNGGHSAISHLGLMLGHAQVHDAMADTVVRRWLEAYMQEVAPTLPPVAGFDLADYQAALVRRFSNPAIRDRLQRLAQDSSTKFQQTLLPPLRERLERGLDSPCLTAALALWIFYLDRLRTDTPARDVYQDVDRDALIARASQAVASGDAGEFLSAGFALPAQHASRAHGQVSTHLYQLRDSGPAALVESLLRG